MQANKCKHCHEFQAPVENDPEGKTTEIIKEVLTLVGKAFTPIVILVIVFTFKPTFEGLIAKTNEAEFLGGKFKFSSRSSSSFSGVLSAYEIYYLIDSADHDADYGGGLNYEHLKTHMPDELEAIESLKEKGLITTKIVKYDGENTDYFGEYTLKTFSTEKGKALLKEIGIKF